MDASPNDNQHKWITPLLFILSLGSILCLYTITQTYFGADSHQQAVLMLAFIIGSCLPIKQISPVKILILPLLCGPLASLFCAGSIAMRWDYFSYVSMEASTLAQFLKAHNHIFHGTAWLSSILLLLLSAFSGRTFPRSQIKSRSDSVLLCCGLVLFLFWYLSPFLIFSTFLCVTAVFYIIKNYSIRDLPPLEKLAILICAVFTCLLVTHGNKFYEWCYKLQFQANGEIESISHSDHDTYHLVRYNSEDLGFFSRNLCTGYVEIDSTNDALQADSFQSILVRMALQFKNSPQKAHIISPPHLLPALSLLQLSPNTRVTQVTEPEGIRMQNQGDYPMKTLNNPLISKQIDYLNPVSYFLNLSYISNSDMVLWYPDGPPENTPSRYFNASIMELIYKSLSDDGVFAFHCYLAGNTTKNSIFATLKQAGFKKVIEINKGITDQLFLALKTSKGLSEVIEKEDPLFPLFKFQIINRSQLISTNLSQLNSLHIPFQPFGNQITQTLRDDFGKYSYQYHPTGVL